MSWDSYTWQPSEIGSQNLLFVGKLPSCPVLLASAPSCSCWEALPIERLQLHCSEFFFSQGKDPTKVHQTYRESRVSSRPKS